MRVDVIPFQDAHQFHFDGVAAAVAHRALAAGRHDQVIVHLAAALLDGTNGVFPDGAAEPLVYCCHLVSPALQLVDAHGPNFQKAVGQKVFDALLCAGQLYSAGSSTRRVLQAAFRHKTIKRSSRPRDRCAHR